jgi:quinol monooxygenase YgiN
MPTCGATAEDRTSVCRPTVLVIVALGTPRSVSTCSYVPGMTYGLFGKFSAQPGKRDDLVGYLLRAAKLLERDPACVQYIVGTSEEPDAVWVSEIWTDEAAHDASLEPEDIQALIQEARPLIAGMSDQTRLTVHGGKGLPG